MSRAKTVLLVDDGNGVWGAQRYLLRLAPLLECRGLELLLATPASSELGHVWRSQGRRTVDIPHSEGRSIRNHNNRVNLLEMVKVSASSLSRADSLARAARREKVQLICANSHWTHLDSALAGRITGIPTVLSLHEEALPGLAVKMRSASVRLSRGAIAVSSDVAQRLTTGVRDRVRVINNGVDADEFSPGPADPRIRAQLAADPASPVVISLSRLDPAKRVGDAIRAVAQIDGLQLAIAGSSSTHCGEDRRLRSLAQALLGERVRFLGNRSDVPQLLRAADVFVLTGSQEGMPLGILEAQATGCPVVAYPAAGVRDAIIDGSTGMISAQEDPETLATCLRRLIEDPELRSHLSANARQRTLMEFSLERQADRCAEFLKEVA